MKAGFFRKKPKGLAGRAEVTSLSVVGPELKVQGQLESHGEIQVSGVVAGNVSAPRVTLLAGGYIEGSIVAEEAYIHGHFNGEATARKVVISASARIQGQIFHHTIEMEKGADVDARFPWRPVNYFEHGNDNPQKSGGASYGEIYAKR